MGEVIVYDISNDFIYLKLPNEYDCVYKELIKALSNTGIKGLLSCNRKLPCSIGTCGYTSEELMDSWNMFQIACAAYELEEVEKADKIVNFIIKRMKFSCPTIIRKYSKIIYYGDSIGEPTVEEIFAGTSLDFYEYPQFTSPFFKNTQYIAIPEGVIIDYIKNSNIGGEYLYNRNTSDDEYTKKRIILNEKSYYLWYVTYAEPLDTSVVINLIEGMWQTDTIIYYNQVDTKPDLITILNSNKFNIITGNSLVIPVYKKGHFIAVPDGYIIKTIENASFRGDWLYNPALNIDVYTKERIELNGKYYTLWYCEFIVPFNASIEIILNI
jgi:hypothetical protein